MIDLTKNAKQVIVKARYDSVVKEIKKHLKLGYTYHTHFKDENSYNGDDRFIIFNLPEKQNKAKLDIDEIADYTIRKLHDRLTAKK